MPLKIRVTFLVVLFSPYRKRLDEILATNSKHDRCSRFSIYSGLVQILGMPDPTEYQGHLELRYLSKVLRMAREEGVPLLFTLAKRLTGQQSI
ncbi:hypothetical protein O9992_15070 [Vibrio lentus]|nr:hypothetical protein [Vibrio lentus]